MKSFFVVFVAVLMLIAITSCGEQAPNYYTVTFYNLGDVGPEGVYVHHILEPIKPAQSPSSVRWG